MTVHTGPTQQPGGKGAAGMHTQSDHEAEAARGRHDQGWFRRTSFADASAALADEYAGRALLRLFGTYVAARAVVGVLLAVLHLGSLVAGTLLSPSAVVISGLYALEGLAVVAWRLRSAAPARASLPGRGLQIATVGADLLAFLLLLGIESNAGFNFGALLVLPVLMSGMLMPRREALATAAVVTLVLLAQAWWTWLRVPFGPSAWLASGLAGTGLFAIAWVSGELAARLLREERSAIDSRERARQQARINQLVIEEMAEGVMVLDRQCRVLATNPAAQALLGSKLPQAGHQDPLLEDAAFQPLLESVESAYAQGARHAVERELTWQDHRDGPRRLRLGIRFTHAAASAAAQAKMQDSGDLCVLLLEDERSVQARVQQEKLAAMGRVSAGIAHEIRNPLAAIAQANELVSEDVLTDSQARLVAMIADNVQRLGRLVDDVLEALPVTVTDDACVELTALITSVVQEWQRTSASGQKVLLMALPPPPVEVLFDPEHLRRVLVNLLENAVRHASSSAGSVRVGVQDSAEDVVVMRVSNDGPPVPPEVEIHMFEPFFSTRSRGSGLGLYLCKELCDRYRAGIGLESQAVHALHRTTFAVRFRRAAARTSRGRG